MRVGGMLGVIGAIMLRWGLSSTVDFAVEFGESGLGRLINSF